MTQWFVICSWLFVCVVFFFQAEDGIRDIGVTGVQTCALPIWSSRGCQSGFRYRRRRGESRRRSEERRVGKECRSRWSPYHEKKKKKKQKDMDYALRECGRCVELQGRGSSR